MTADIDKIKAEIKAEVKAEVVAELTSRKRTDSAWKTARKNLQKKVFEVFGQHSEGWRVLDSIANISRAVFGVRNVNCFTENDIAEIEVMMDEILSVAANYKNEHVTEAV